MPFPAVRLSPRAARPARPVREVRRLERALLCYAGFEDFVLLYPVYALLFADHGLSTAEISVLFGIWSLTGVLLEVPSGVWADVVSRRLLLVAGPLLSAAGFGLWVAFPSFPVFAAGFVLWGAGSALRSGALEALVYEELASHGACSRYPRLMGRARAVGTACTATAGALAAPVFTLAGYSGLGAASVAACLLCAFAATRLPEHRQAAADPAPADRPPACPAPADSTPACPAPADNAPACPAPADNAPADEAADLAGSARGYLGTLRDGLAEAHGSPAVRNALLLAVAVTTVWGSLDEYVPLLAAEAGATTAEVPLLTLLVWAGVTAGGLLAGTAGRLSGRSLGAAVALASGALAAGALWGIPGGFVLLGLAFAVFQAADVVTDARLQDAVTGPSRATVTSLGGLGTGLTTLLVYAAYGAASGRTSHATLFALSAVPYLVIAAAMARRRGPAVFAGTRPGVGGPTASDPEPDLPARDSGPVTTADA
ncbi:MFS transporter [Kitasatospora sp. NBC_00240]|uniref:MFS transporter n=1 Tax=Kitasatospora sp. NBC_00240 TaxID=2903567 RepID=UPI002259D46E|nr:MFS transporter [Kitasatospora sp. NBC_00240]MCX5214335.1 MFS transporter [Kitasatospora sp. NBC_00240]